MAFCDTCHKNRLNMKTPFPLGIDWRFKMSRFLFNSTRTQTAGLLLLVVLGIALPFWQRTQPARKKKATTATAAADGSAQVSFDPKKLVWPSPPNIARVRWLDYFAGVKIDYSPAEAAKPKASWMDRLAGSQSQQEKVNTKTFPFQLIGPYGIAIDSKGLVYVADQRVGAVFIFNTETHDTQLIRNGYEAHFGWINGLAIDDDDRLFVSDGKLHRVLDLQPQARSGRTRSPKDWWIRLAWPSIRRIVFST